MVHKAHLEASLHAYVLKNIPPKQKQTTKKKNGQNKSELLNAQADPSN